MTPQRHPPFVLLLILVVSVASAAVAQAGLVGHLSVTYRHDGNAQAAVVSVSDRTLAFDGAALPAEDPAALILGEYAWDLAPDGSTVLLHRLTLMSMAGEVVVRNLSEATETVVTPREGTVLVPSTARLAAAGDRVLFQYRDANAADTRNLMLGLWENGASVPFAGEPTLGIVAFGLAPNGTVAYLALPLGTEDAAPEIFTGTLSGGEVERFGTLPSDAPLALNPSVTSVSMSADGTRAMLSTPERSETLGPIRMRSFGIELSTGTIHTYPVDENGGLADASISPDGTLVVGYQPETGQLMVADFGDPGSLRPLGAPLQVAPDRPVAWSQDGTHIAFANVVEGSGYQAFALPVAGGDPVQLTDFEEGLWNGAFSWGR